jgi:hypothetical protein
LKVKKITRPFVFLEVSGTKEYGTGAQMTDGDTSQIASATQPVSPGQTTNKGKKASGS